MEIIILSSSDLKTMMERAVEQFKATGRVPTFEELEEANLLTDLQIRKLMDD